MSGTATAGLGLSAYIDVPAYLRAPTGQETATLLGLNTTLSDAAGAVVGATSLAVGSSTGWTASSAWILDGPSSEVVTITGSADATHVTLAAPGLAFAHAAGVSLSQAGSAGCLAEVILRASAWIDNYCQQGTAGGDRTLWALARTERWGMPTARAYVDRDATLAVMVGHFPVQSVAAVSIDLGQGQSVTLDATHAEIPGSGGFVFIPYLLQGVVTPGMQLSLDRMGLSRSRRQWAVVSYTGGVTPGSVPYDVQQAAVWVVSDLLSQRQNPTGAAEQQLGKRRLIQRQRGDAIGDSILLLRAHDLLQPYRAEVWG